MRLPVINQQVEKFEFESLSNFAAPIYLDNNATTICDDDALDGMILATIKNYANPSGTHKAGQVARDKVEIARGHVATFIGCTPEEVIFTSGGTESINSVITSAIATTYPRRNIITCHTEHGATLNRLKALPNDYNALYLDVDNEGRFATEQLKEYLASSKVGLVSLMAANNETGTIHRNIYEAVRLAHEYGALFHLDAVQIAGKMLLAPYIESGTDFLTISGHKFHAPKGVGALFVKKGVAFEPFIRGGYQENNMRAGTENVPGIVALGIVAEQMPACGNQLRALHEKFLRDLLQAIPTCIINGGGVPGTINVGFQYVHREALLMKMSQHDLYASAGSACAKGIEPSHVLSAMKVPNDYIHGSVRFSMSKYTTENEITRAIEIITKAYNELRDMSRGIVV